MKYIKVKLRLSCPATEDFEVYGFDTVWQKKTQMLGSEAIQFGQVVSFQPVTVKPDGKCLILATEKNIKALKGMLSKDQITLGPGEELEFKEEAPKAQVDEWPSEPGVAPEQPEDEVAEEAVVKPKARGPRKNIDLTPDKE